MLAENKFAESMDHIIGIILGLKEFPSGFMENEDTLTHCSFYPTGQLILNHIAKLWKKVVVSNHGLSEQTISVLYDILQSIGEDLGEYQFDVGVPPGMDQSNDGEQKGDDDADEESERPRFLRLNGLNDNGKRSRSSAENEGDSDGNEGDENPRPRQRRR